jgi:flagellar basal body-associated protein FliL
MKMEQLIVQYLYSNKKVTLQDIGTFSISSDVNIPLDNEKDSVLPEDYIQFTYDPKASVDDGLVDYIITHTRKIKPLATSDLESYVMLNKQFLNIGKPLILEGIGTLQKAQTGIYTFAQAGNSHVMLTETPKVVTEKVIEKISFATPEKEKSTGKSKIVVLGALTILGLAALGLGGYYLFNKFNTNTYTDNTETKETKEIVKQNNNATTTETNSGQPKDTSKPIAPVVINTADSNTFYVIEKEYPNLELASKRIAQLRSYGDKALLVTKDSITYKIKIGFRKPITDTLRIKDSVASQYGTKGKSYVEMP